MFRIGNTNLGSFQKITFGVVAKTITGNIKFRTSYRACKEAMRFTLWYTSRLLVQKFHSRQKYCLTGSGSSSRLASLFRTVQTNAQIVAIDSLTHDQSESIVGSTEAKYCSELSVS